LVAEDEDLDVLGEVAPSGDEQAQQGREGEVAEGEQHQPILSSRSLPNRAKPSPRRLRPWKTETVRVLVDRAAVAAILARLGASDQQVGEDARAAVEWLTGGDDDVPAVFSRRELQLFLWSQALGASGLSARLRRVVRRCGAYACAACPGRRDRRLLPFPT
jgi:hypothetical protein